MQRRARPVEATESTAPQRKTRDVRQQRRLPVGADVLPAGDVHVRVWASQRQRVEVVLAGRPGTSSEAAAAVGALEPEGTSYCSGLVAEASTGTLYRYRLDGEAALSPDPASRFQPHGPHGPSQVIDPGVFPWQDQDWRGVPLEGQGLYEMHLGTCTPAWTRERS